MHFKIHSTMNGRYFIRSIKFKESEVEYSSADFSQAIEIDLKNNFTHLEMTADSFQITVEETTQSGGSRTRMQTEDVLLVIWGDAKYFPGDLEKLASDLSCYDPMNTGYAYSTLAHK